MMLNHRRIEMKTRKNTWKRMAEELGSAMMIGWTMLLGPLGAVALLVMAYSMFAQNLALGIVAGLIVFAPLMLTVTWAPFSWMVIRAEALPMAQPVSVGKAS